MATKNESDVPTADTTTPPADTVVASRTRTPGLIVGVAGGALAALVLAGGGFVLGFNLGHGVGGPGGQGGPGTSQGMPEGGPGELRESGQRPGGADGPQQRDRQAPPRDRQAPPQDQQAPQQQDEPETDPTD